MLFVPELWLAHDVHIGFIPVCKILGEIRDKVIVLHIMKSHSVIYQNLRERETDRHEETETVSTMCRTFSFSD